MKHLNKKKFLLIQDINTDDKTLSFKIFRFFYSLSKVKRELNPVFKYLQIFIETIQLISYIFSKNHYDSWKLSQTQIKQINNVIGSFRLSILMHFFDYKVYLVILYILVIIIFLICLILILQILFIDSSSKKYRIFMIIIRSIIDLISIIFYIPITEIILLPIRCLNGKVYEIKNGERCWKNIHYLHSTLGIIGSFLLFSWCIFMINFSFYPFQKFKSTIRINSNNDIIILIMKIILVLQYLFISNEYISVAILMLVSIVIFFNCFYEPTYNIKRLQIAINIKNLLIMWSYFVLFLSKIFSNFKANGFIYLLIYGYPLIIYFSIIISKEKFYDEISLNSNIYNLKDYIKKAEYNIQLINSFIERNKNMRNGNSNKEQKNIILLRGNIEYHNKVCTNNECPLIKFTNNEGNFIIQRQSLLNYMNLFFNKGFKKFPNSVYLLILYIQLNYSNRFNLNSVKANLYKLKNIECSLKDKFIIFCMEESIKDNNNNDSYNSNNRNEEDNDSQEDINDQKYQKLKYLIENSIKLYAEFWGIFTTNIISIINKNKLYSLGEKINIYLNEINSLWDNELKNKKINNENQNIVQLYSKFLLEILWDRKKSREIAKKLNDENLNIYSLNDNKKDKDEKKNNLGNIESILDNQDYILFCDSDEKGNSKIIQCSASLSQLLGYQKYDMIGKSLEIIFPNLLIEQSLKYLEECIKSLHNKENDQKELYQENDSNKNIKLIILKSKMGYIMPLFASFTIIKDNDYSDSFLVKIKIERKEVKSEYAYYILSNPDLIIENISSSAINLGLTLDLLKKYVINLNILIRTENDKILNIYENYNLYEEETREVTWVFPNIIYPKDNNKQIKDEEIEELIEISQKKKYNIQIREIQSDNTNKNIALVFKFTENNIKKKQNKINNEMFFLKSNKHLVMFDLINLTYIRALIVDKKTGLRNLRNLEADNDKKIVTKLSLKKPKKRKKSSASIEEAESSEESDKNLNTVLLTKDKIIEMQVNNASDIKDFIFSLPIYGKDIALERFRPNGDKYSASKITEPSIKIQISHFCKRIDEITHLNQNTKKRKNKIFEENNTLNSQKSSNTDNYLFSSNKKSSPLEISEHNTDSQKEEINKGLAPETSSSLSNIFKAHTINYIRILIGLGFLLTFLFLLIEFIITYNQMNKLKKKIYFLYNGYKTSNNILYIKYLVTEGVLGNILKMDYAPVIYNMANSSFIENIVKELAKCREEFSEIYDIFSSNELCKEYEDYIEKATININTLTVNKSKNITVLLSIGMTRIPAAVNDLVSDPFSINMNNRDTYELMYNLVNVYYLNWKKVILILYNDSINSTKLRLPLKIIMIAYFIISIIILILLLKLLSLFSLDREKAINLFLTLKKQVFENLKTSAENFSNKILNKFFGNEENEDEYQLDYQSNIQPNDINIIKFKAANEYNYSIKKAFDFALIIIIVLAFLLLFFFYFVVKFLDYRQKMEEIYQFLLLFEKTNEAQNDYIISYDNFKSYLFNKSIPILNKTNTEKEFIETFLNLTNKFEESIILNSKDTSFLGDKFLIKYSQYLNGNFGELIDLRFFEEHKNLLYMIENGLKPIQIKFYEIIKYYTIKYYKYSKLSGIDFNNDDISFILKQKEFKLYEINIMVESIMRLWYRGILKLMVTSFNDFIDGKNLIYIIIFICLIIIAILYYCIIWKTYEEKLNTLLKNSSDLINLLPQEIKNIIIEKLNE